MGFLALMKHVGYWMANVIRSMGFCGTVDLILMLWLPLGLQIDPSWRW
jgi:hypothetical protein